MSLKENNLCSNKGYGIFHGTHWIYGAFHPLEVETGDKNNIRERELYPILIACQTFGPYWTGHRVRIYIDNDNALQAIINKDIRSETAHKLLIRICEEMMKYAFEIRAERIKTEETTYANALSRLQNT